MTIVGMLVAARERAGLTQAAVAEAAGVSVETVSRIERGLHEPELATVISLSRAMGYELLLVGPPGSADPAAPPEVLPPLVRLLADTAARLDPGAQRAVLRICELLVDAGPPADPGSRRTRRRGSARLR
jgi:transcriptional regulator with XRE-family HTH domain